MNESKSHPSYGHITIGRQSSNRERLFGTASNGHNTISIEISEATFEHDPDSGMCYVHPAKRILEVSMSPLQFAEAIASLNCAEGQACTITWREGKGFIKTDDEPTTKREILARVFEKAMRDLDKDCVQFVDRAKALRDKANVNKGDREEFVKLAESLVAVITRTVPYVASQFTDVVERILAEAKADQSCAPSSSSAPPSSSPSTAS